MAKTIARSAGKYIVERSGEHAVEKRYGREAALGVRIVGSLYNLFSEQADLRSWQTLPAEIRMARLITDPGEYDLVLDNFDEGNVLLEERSLGKLELKAGEIKFLIVRTVY